MQRSFVPDCRALESELIGAALRYVALADWFESRPVAHCRRAGEREAMEAFNVVETQLRRAGKRLLRRLGHRELVLEQVLAETMKQ